MSTCDDELCEAAANHLVSITFPDAAEEIWNVCRRHDRSLKLEAVRSRQKAEPANGASTPQATVECGQCHQLLAEPSDLPVENRQPCPDCRSLSRHMNITLSDTVIVHECLRVRTKQAGKGGWRVDTRTGDDYTHDLAAWGKREFTTDRDADRYREAIELYDGTRIVSTARLSDHRD
jgi:hypothetical protein